MNQVSPAVPSVLSALVTFALLSGCTPTPPGPSTSPAPTVATTTPSPSEATSPSTSPTPDRETAIKQAETAYGSFHHDLYELLKKGGAARTPPNIASKIAGPYQKSTDATIASFHSDQLTISGDVTIGVFAISPKTKPWPTNELIFDLFGCLTVHPAQRPEQKLGPRGRLRQVRRQDALPRFHLEGMGASSRPRYHKLLIHDLFRRSLSG